MPGPDDIEIEEEVEDVVEPTEEDGDHVDDDLEPLDFDFNFDLEDEEDEEKPEKKVETKGEPEDKDNPIQILEATVAGLKKQLDDVNKRANSAAYAARKATEKKGEGKGDEEASLSREQIKGMMAEHGHDPEVMYNIFEYVAEQKAKGVAADSINAQQVTQVKAQLDQYMDQEFPDHKEEGSDAHRSLSEVKGRFNLDDHPFGSFLAMTALSHMNSPNTVKAAYDQGVKDALNKKVETNRLKNIKGNRPTPKGKPKTTPKGGLTAAQKATAKQLGLSDSQSKIMARIVGNKSGTVEV